jgi:MT0933-like antitoxin protein
MGFLDDAKKFIDEHDDQVDQAIEKAGDLVDDKTGHRYADQVDTAQDVAQEKTGDGDTRR